MIQKAVVSGDTGAKITRMASDRASAVEPEHLKHVEALPEGFRRYWFQISMSKPEP